MWNPNIFSQRKALKFSTLYAKIGKDFDIKKAMNVQVVNYTFFRERESSAGSSLKVR